MSFQDKYRNILQHLLARPLREQDGIAVSEAKSLAAKSELVIPLALSDYYLVGGNLPLNSAHNRLLAPNELHTDQKQATMVFMDENQSVCAWGIRVDELHEDDPVVFQGQPDTGDWFSEKCTMSQWLEIYLYLQCCWGGLEFSCDHINPHSVMNEIRGNWRKVVDHNGLTIWEDEGVVVSDLGEPWCIGAANTRKGLAKLEKLGFEPQ